MRSQRSLAFQYDASKKLDRLELIAALLEREASHNRAWIAELGHLPATRSRRAPRTPRFGRFAVAGLGAARTAWRLAVAVATSKRLHAGVWEAYVFIVDFAVVFGAILAGMAILAIAVMIAAPPV